MRGATEIRNRPAIVDAPVGKGRVVLFATNPCYRWQNHGEFGMLFNARAALERHAGGSARRHQHRFPATLSERDGRRRVRRSTIHAGPPERRQSTAHKVQPVV